MDTEKLQKPFTTGLTEGSLSSHASLRDVLAEALKAKLDELEKDKEVKVETDTPKPASVFFLFDRSGSMASRLTDAQGGYDTFIKEQAKIPDTQISLWDFDTQHELIYELTDATKIPVGDEAKAYKLIPRGGTALLDAITRLIAYAEKHKKDGTVVNVVILTDGEENSSKEASDVSVKALIEEKQKEGWVFVYLGANQDAITVAQSYGIPMASAATFDLSRATTTSGGTSSMLYAGRQGKGYAFTNAQRKSFNPGGYTGTNAIPPGATTVWIGPDSPVWNDEDYEQEPKYKF